MVAPLRPKSASLLSSASRVRMLTPLFGQLGPLAVASGRFDPSKDPDYLLDVDFSGATSGLIWQEPGQVNATGANQVIGRIRDQGPFGYHHDQSSASLGMAEGDGSNDYLDYASTICNSSKLTMFAVVRVIRTSFPGPSNTLDTVWTSGDSGNIAYGFATYNSYATQSNNRFGTDPPLAANGSINGSSVTIPQNISNSASTYILSASYATTPTSNTGSRLFGYRNGILPGKVQLGRLILVNRTMTFAEQAPWLAYLNRIWQVF